MTKIDPASRQNDMPGPFPPPLHHPAVAASEGPGV